MGAKWLFSSYKTWTLKLPGVLPIPPLFFSRPMSYNQNFSSTHGQNYPGMDQPALNYGPTPLNVLRPRHAPANPLMANAHNHTEGSSSTLTYFAAGPSIHMGPARIKQFDWGVLTPGQPHQVSVDVAPSPQSVMDGSFQRSNALKEKDIVLYTPRRPDFCGPPSIPSILFSVKGRPGPYIRDIAKGRLIVDDPHDQVLLARVWKQTWYMIEWPGTENSKETISCFGEKGEPITRANLAALISVRLCQFFVAAKSGKLKWGPQRLDHVSKDWDLAEVDYKDVRLMGLNYYRKIWIPVLAVDVFYD